MKAIAGKHERRVREGAGWIVRGGKTEYCILVPPQPDGSVKKAVGEFTFFFEQATGIRLACEEEGGGKEHCFAFGDTRLGEGVQTPFESFGESGYRIANAGNSYILKGGSYGVLYAAYDLLGILFGYETFSDRTIRLNRGVTDLPFLETEIAEVPDFRFRSPSHAHIKYNERLKNRFRMIDLEDLLGGEGGPYHNNFNFIPPEKFAAEHPLWYSDDGLQMCYTAHGNEYERELLESEAAEAIARYIRRNPEKPYIAFNHQDNFEWCGCPACTALKEKYEGANSASAAIFLNRVRAKLQKWFDGEGSRYDRGQKLVFFAYHGTNRPPVRYDEASDTFSPIDGETVLKGVIPWFAETNADYTVPLYEGETNAPVARNLRGWKLLSDEILFWTYGTNFENYLAPYYSFEATRETYRFAKENGAGMIFDECQINARVCTAWEELKGYLGASLAWNTEADTEALTKDFFEASYGSAAQRMLSVFAEYCKRGREQVQAGFSGWRSEFIDPIDRRFWRREELERWESEMTAALGELTDAEPQRALITRNIVLERAWVRYLLAEVYAEDYSDAELRERRAKAVADLRESGIDRFNEKKKIDVLFEKWAIEN